MSYVIEYEDLIKRFRDIIANTVQEKGKLSLKCNDEYPIVEINVSSKYKGIYQIIQIEDVFYNGEDIYLCTCRNTDTLEEEIHNLRDFTGETIAEIAEFTNMIQDE